MPQNTVANFSNQMMPLIARGVTYQLNLSPATGFNIDMTTLQSSGQISGLQSVYIDNSNGTAPLILLTNSSNIAVRCPAGAQGFFPLLVSGNPQFTVNGVGTVSLTFLNVPMPIGIWGGVNANQYASDGALIVSDTALETTILGGRIATNPLVSGTLTSGSGTTAAAVSTQLFAANNARQYLAIQSPATADMWINPNGGAAGVNLADCFRVPENTFYESGRFVSASQINYYCATGGLEFTAFEA